MTRLRALPSPERQTMRLAGEARVPFTSGILIGIGETSAERVESLLALRAIQREFGNLQEVIVQNFRAKPGTRMANAPEPDVDELLWSIAVARLVFGPGMSIQAPPNLSPGVLPQLVEAGINDWGGVSPLTPHFVNPEAPWPHLAQLAAETAAAGKFLQERLTIYPAYVREGRALGRREPAAQEVVPVFQLLVYPMLDDRKVFRSDIDDSNNITWNHKSNRFGWESYLGMKCGAEAVPEYALPARRKDLSALPPAWIGVGALDLFYEEDTAYAQRLNEARVPCELYTIRGAFHGFDVIVSDVPIAQQFRSSQIEALRNVLFS